MKLYYRSGACSLSPHIAWREAGPPVELDKMDRATRMTDSGVDFMAVNPLGYVPALQLDNGQVRRGGNSFGRIRHWQPVCGRYKIASAIPRSRRRRGRPSRRAGGSSGSTKPHSTSFRSLA